MQAVAQPCATKDIVSTVCLRDALTYFFYTLQIHRKFDWNLVQSPT